MSADALVVVAGYFPGGLGWSSEVSNKQGNFERRPSSMQEVLRIAKECGGKVDVFSTDASISEDDCNKLIGKLQTILGEANVRFCGQRPRDMYPLSGEQYLCIDTGSSERISETPKFSYAVLAKADEQLVQEIL